MLIESPTGSLRIPPPSALAPASVLFSLVLPTYNESRNVAAIVAQISQLLDQQIPDQYELLLVDDDSPDYTWKVALELSAAYPALRVIRRVDERGLSSAVVRGWQAARGEILGVIDADLQHPPEMVLKLLHAVETGADLAVASRHVAGGGVSEWSFTRRFLSRGAQTLGLAILPRVVGRVSDPMSGYFLVRRSAIADVTLYPKGYKILLEVIGRGQVGEIAEVGYVFQERVAGESKVTWRQYVDYLHHLLRLRSRGRIAQFRAKFPVDRFLRFGVVGFSGLFVDYTVFFLLFGQAGLGLTTSNILSAETAIINNFIWNDAWTFADFAQQQLGWAARFKRFLKFNLVCLAGLVLNTLLVNLFFNVFGINAYLAKFLAIVIVTFWNFWINLKLSWRVTQPPK
ncbi:glycosyltransferase [Leptolyngbya sp. PCC 6406]|uniref:glycosyltransferase n=1 Tax=Leptolyngbya sp. PCC 6406 TaxID=1173264 RepID=UPI0002ACEC6D|nr:glycosyltransferase [Leptolyngbya sp. PCC 6406]